MIYYKNSQAVPVIQEVAALRYDDRSPDSLNGAQVEGLKINLLENIEKSRWPEMLGLLEKLQNDDPNIRIQTKAKQVLKLLKN